MTNKDFESTQFIDWFNREDSGNRAQLLRCWNAAVTAKDDLISRRESVNDNELIALLDDLDSRQWIHSYGDSRDNDTPREKRNTLITIAERDTLSAALRERLAEPKPPKMKWPEDVSKGWLSGYDYVLLLCKLNGFNCVAEAVEAAVRARASSPSSLAGGADEVTAALNELREMFPDYWIQIDRTLRYEPEMNAEPACHVRISIDKLTDDFESETLTEAIRQARDLWKTIQ